MNIIEYLKKDMQKSLQKHEQEKAKQKQQETAKIMEQSGIKRRFRKRTFETFNITETNKKAYSIAKDFVINFEKQQQGLLLIGNVGTGKTHIAAAIANYLINNMYTVIFGNVTDIISRIYSTYDKESNITTKEVMYYLTSVDLLIIDDLGKEYSSDNTSSLLYQIINTLYEDERLVVITTNLNGNELSQKLGQATVSRLTEMTRPVIMQGQDWRIKNANRAT